MSALTADDPFLTSDPFFVDAVADAVDDDDSDWGADLDDVSDGEGDW